MVMLHNQPDRRLKLIDYIATLGGFVINREITPGRITLVLVNEVLGF